MGDDCCNQHNGEEDGNEVGGRRYIWPCIIFLYIHFPLTFIIHKLGNSNQPLRNREAVPYSSSFQGELWVSLFHGHDQLFTTSVFFLMNHHHKLDILSVFSWSLYIRTALLLLALMRRAKSLFVKQIMKVLNPRITVLTAYKVVGESVPRSYYLPTTVVSVGINVGGYINKTKYFSIYH